MKQFGVYFLCTLLLSTTVFSCGGYDDEGNGNTDKSISAPIDAKAIDLGLSVKWANMNIGANHPWEDGYFFSWGEIFTKDNYSIETYSLTSDGGNAFIRYDEGKCELEKYDDVARIKWGEKWRMPTEKEMEELCNNCFWRWTERYNNNDVSGYMIFKVKDDEDRGKVSLDGSFITKNAIYQYSDNHIFLPSSGIMVGTLHRKYTGEAGDDPLGEYWTSTLGEKKSSAVTLDFCSSWYKRTDVLREVGLPVRVVQ